MKTLSDPTLAALVPAFLAKRRAELGSLEACLEEQDWVSLSGHGHRLRGVGALYGHEAISTFGGELEAAAAAKDAKGAARTLATYRDYLARPA